MAATPRGERLTSAYQAATAALGERLALLLVVAWGRVADDSDVTFARWLAAAVPAVLGAQARAVAVTDAYLAAYLTAEGVTVGALGLDPRNHSGVALRGAPIEEVYARPFTEARIVAEEKGLDLRSALAAERARVFATAATDVQLAARSARLGWAEQVPRVIGWRRALGSGRHCALCTANAGAVYPREMLMPIHQHCQCVTEPVLAGEGRQRTPPTGAVNDSPGLREAAEEGKQVFRIEEHGELGPVLVAAGQEFSREG